MNQTNPTAGELPPELTLDDLIDRYGLATVLRGLAAALLHRRRRRRDGITLPDHLRRDIGLPERGEPPPRLRGPWM